MKFLTILISILLTSQVYAARLNYESWYQALWCEGTENVKMSDGTYADCVTETHAIEFDFANKWYEAVGQSLHYAQLTGLKPGIVLILESEKDEKYLQRLKDLQICPKISIWEIRNK